MVALQVKLVPLRPFVLGSGKRMRELERVSVAIGRESNPWRNHSSVWMSSPFQVQAIASETPGMKENTPLLLVELVVSLPVVLL